MTDLTNLISSAVAAKLTPDFIEKEINNKIEKLIVDSIDSAMRSYSETGALIKKAVSDALRVDSLDLPAYGATVCKILKTQIEARVSDLVSGQLAKDMDELLKLAPKEVKLSEIAEEMLEYNREFGEGGITVIVERDDYGYSTIYLDERTSDKYGLQGPGRKHDCRYSLSVDKYGKIYTARIDKKDVRDVERIGRSYGIGQKISAYVACGTTMIIDEDDVVTEAEND